MLAHTAHQRTVVFCEAGNILLVLQAKQLSITQPHVQQYCPDARAVWPSKRTAGTTVPDPGFVTSLYAFAVDVAAEFLKSEEKDVLRQDGDQEVPVARLVHWYVPIPCGSGSS